MGRYRLVRFGNTSLDADTDDDTDAEAADDDEADDA
jgi:hypothetical protein